MAVVSLERTSSSKDDSKQRGSRVGGWGTRPIPGYGDYSYPNTYVWFVQGANDEPNIRRGMTYHDLLIENRSPMVRLDVLPGVSHRVPATRLGADKILDILINECRPRHE